jgi:hypothetical protein
MVFGYEILDELLQLLSVHLQKRLCKNKGQH